MGLGIVLYLGLGLTSCFGTLLLLYNLIGVVRFFRGTDMFDDRPASPLAIGAWVLSLVSLLLGPCGLFTAVIAMILARVENGRVYAEQSSMRSLLPCHMANINGVVAIILMLILTVTLVSGML